MQCGVVLHRQHASPSNRISMAQFSVSIWCAYDTHLPHTPKPNHCVSYARQNQFSRINSTPNKTANLAIETHIHEIGSFTFASSDKQSYIFYSIYIYKILLTKCLVSSSIHTFTYIAYIHTQTYIHINLIRTPLVALYCMFLTY